MPSHCAADSCAASGILQKRVTAHAQKAFQGPADKDGSVQKAIFAKVYRSDRSLSKWQTAKARGFAQQRLWVSLAPINCRDCSPLLDNTQVAGRSRVKLEMEMLEAACEQDRCISVASVHFMSRELQFINND